MAGNTYYVPRVVYRFLPLIYIGAGLLALFNVTNLIGTVSSLLLITAGVLAFIWRCRAATRRRGRSKPKPRADSHQPEYDYPDTTTPAPETESITSRPPNTSRKAVRPTADVAQHSAPPAHKTGRAALFQNPRLNRRDGDEDRRGWEPMPDTPFRDSAGAFVKRDRRRSPERRKNSIEVREVPEREGSDL